MSDKGPNPIAGGLLHHVIKVVNQDGPLYITATQVKELDSLYQVQHGVSIQPHPVACILDQLELSKNPFTR